MFKNLPQLYLTWPDGLQQESKVCSTSAQDVKPLSPHTLPVNLLFGDTILGPMFLNRKPKLFSL